MIFDGKTIPVKQCMGDNEEIDVETIDLDNEEQRSSANAAYRVKRFLGILTVKKDFMLSFSILITQLIIKMRALWLVEDCVISRYNHPARGDYNTEALIFKNDHRTISWCFWRRNE